jgi:hypothetical protein
LLPTLVLLAEFILAMEAVHILLANFAGPIITLVEISTDGNAYKIEGVSAESLSSLNVSHVIAGLTVCVKIELVGHVAVIRQTRITFQRRSI